LLSPVFSAMERPASQPASQRQTIGLVGIVGIGWLSGTWLPCVHELHSDDNEMETCSVDLLHGLGLTVVACLRWNVGGRALPPAHASFDKEGGVSAPMTARGRRGPKPRSPLFQPGSCIRRLAATPIGERLREMKAPQHGDWRGRSMGPSIAYASLYAQLQIMAPGPFAWSTQLNRRREATVGEPPSARK